MSQDLDALLKAYDLLELQYNNAQTALRNSAQGVLVRSDKEKREQLIRRLREREWPLHAIADALTAARIETPQRGFSWRHSTIAAILKSTGGDPVKSRLAPHTKKYKAIMEDVAKGIPKELLI